MNFKEVIFIAGYPGAGKGTICQEYSLNQPDFYHVSAGDLIRDVITQKNVSKFREPLITTGDKETKTSPAWVISGIMNERISLDPQRVCLLDGFPQRKEELDIFANDKSIKIVGSIFFDASLDNCVQRMGVRGIRDFELFDKKLLDRELIDYYKNRYMHYSSRVADVKCLLTPFNLYQIDANQNVPSVYNQFQTIISQLKQRKK